MYSTTDKPIRLFQLPNTLAGDAGVTILVQCIITWMIELVLVKRDLRAGQVAPVGWLRQPSNRAARWFLLLDRAPSGTNGTTGAATKTDGDSAEHGAAYLGSQLLRGFLTAVPSFCLLWGPCVGILTAVGTREGGDWVFRRTWAPQVSMFLLGGLLALLTTPLSAVFWLVRAGWALQTNAGRPREDAIS